MRAAGTIRARRLLVQEAFDCHPPGLLFDWAVLAVDDEESILAEDDGQRAEATCGGYLLVARSWAVSGEASWHVEAGYDETPDQPAGGDIPASSLLAAQLAAEAYVLGRMAADPAVGLVSRAAVAEARRADLAAIDRDHLYEPCPARHGLQDMMRYLPPDTIVFRRAADGSGITATEMLDMLQRDTAEAVDFLRDVHGAAVRAVQLRANQMASLSCS